MLESLSRPPSDYGRWGSSELTPPFIGNLSHLETDDDDDKDDSDYQLMLSFR